MNVDLNKLRLLVSAGSVKSFLVKAQGEKWSVAASVGRERVLLMTDRGDVRLFKSLDTVAKTLHAIGVAEWAVDATYANFAQRSVV